MSAIGLALLALVGALLVSTGLPAYVVLLAASVIGAMFAVLSGSAPVALLGALPGRLISLFESDLMQALPLFVLMGALLNRMAVVPALFKTLVWLLPAKPGSRLVSGLTLGALLGPMSGSVGASVIALSRAVEPSLAANGVPPATRHAMIALASTLGVVVPPSLVLILLGDAMLSAHTIAINATGRTDRILNTQDVMRSALVPALMVVVASLIIAWITGNRDAKRRALLPGEEVTARSMERPTGGEIMLALTSLVLLLVLLGGVATGTFFAVEAAATGAVLLFLAGLVTGRLNRPTLSPMLTDVMTTTGALFAPLLAATTFTLVLRLLGTDKLIERWITGLPGGEIAAVCVILGALALTAFVLDAFEIIFVIVPILIPPLLMRAADAAWVSSLVLLTLQLSFLIPPAGYALMMTRGVLGNSNSAEPNVSSAAITWALAPFLMAQVFILVLVVAQPRLVHLLDNKGARERGLSGPAISKEELEKRFLDMSRPNLPIGAPAFGAPPAMNASPALTAPPRFD
jgi:tripartite ATP-independent transporter DctM subunit